MNVKTFLLNDIENRFIKAKQIILELIDTKFSEFFSTCDRSPLQPLVADDINNSAETRVFLQKDVTWDTIHHISSVFERLSNISRILSAEDSITLHYKNRFFSVLFGFVLDIRRIIFLKTGEKLSLNSDIYTYFKLEENLKETNDDVFQHSKSRKHLKTTSTKTILSAFEQEYVRLCSFTITNLRDEQIHITDKKFKKCFA